MSDAIIHLAAAQQKQGRVITLADGELLRVLAETQDAILADASGKPVFQRGGMLVHLQRSRIAGKAAGIRRPAGALTIATASREWLRLRMAAAAKFQKHDGRAKREVPKDPPMELAAALSSADDLWRFAPLLGIVEAPTLRMDGSILEQPGYDEASGLFFDPNSTVFPEIPAEPSKDDAVEALTQLQEVISEFPFVDKTANAVVLAAILTVLVRRSLRTAPMFIFDAPTMGSGKTLLCEVAGILATGRTLPAMSYTGNEQEERKRITAALACGDPVLLIDNIGATLKGDAISAVLTQEMWRDRVLGVSQVVTLPTSCTWFGTGNNIEVAGDLSTRVLKARIDPQCELPEEREFEREDLRSHVLANRGRLVVAALSILRAYDAAGRPKQGLKPFGRFEAWSDLVRSALVWLDCNDPCLSRERITQNDPVRAGLGQVLDAWHTELGKAPHTSAEVVRHCTMDNGCIQLRDALETVLPKGELKAHALGKWLFNKIDRVVDGFVLRRHATKHSCHWRVDKTRESEEDAG